MRKGFTFIELLVVITIIAVLTSAALVSFRTTNRNARDSKRKADLEQIRSGLEICRVETGTYPGGVTEGGSISCGGQVYLNLVPSDPRTGQPGYGYTYAYDALNNTYSLCATTMEGSAETSPYCVTNP